jgi:hypothetical protein
VTLELGAQILGWDAQRGGGLLERLVHGALQRRRVLADVAQSDLDPGNAGDGVVVLPLAGGQLVVGRERAVVPVGPQERQRQGWPQRLGEPLDDALGVGSDLASRNLQGAGAACGEEADVNERDELFRWHTSPRLVSRQSNGAPTGGPEAIIPNEDAQRLSAHARKNSSATGKR